MATVEGNLWMHNLTLVRVVDVSDDYRLMQPAMPRDFYPVIQETWLPTFRLANRLSSARLFAGYLYDWHEQGEGMWTVGVVAEGLALGDPNLDEVLGVESVEPPVEGSIQAAPL